MIKQLKYFTFSASYFFVDIYQTPKPSIMDKLSLVRQALRLIWPT